MSLGSRLAGCGALCLLPAIPIALRLAHLQVLSHDRLSARARAEMTGGVIEIVPRGRILDRHGRVLAESLPSWSACLDPSLVEDPVQAARRLAAALGLDPAFALRQARRPGRFAWLKRRLSPEEASRAKGLRLKGLSVIPDEARCYPSGDLARGILGELGEDGRGLSGLELAYDAVLGGAARRVRVLRDGQGRALASLDPALDHRPPADIVVTIDRRVQHYAQEALAEAAARHRPRLGVILVADPSTGELLAVAQHPAEGLKAPAFQATYEPGSTYKIVTMAGVLDEGLSRPGDPVDSEGGRWEVSPSVVVKDHHPHGVLSLEAVMEVSSNIGMAKLGLSLGPERFHRASRAFGFGSRTGLGFPGESAGRLKPPQALDRVVLANNSFGQGLAVTPIQMLAAFGALANGGTLLEPRLVVSVDGRATPGPIAVRRVASRRSVEILRGMLEGVVLRGTGIPAAVSGYSVAGKTGTSQKLDPLTRSYSKTDYVASFIGFAPASRPRLAVAVILDSPQGQYYGSDVAAPVFSRLMARLLALAGEPPDAPAPPPSWGRSPPAGGGAPS